MIFSFFYLGSASSLMQEQLRSFLTYNGTYGLEQSLWHSTSDLAFCGCMNMFGSHGMCPPSPICPPNKSPGDLGSSELLSSRMARQMITIVVQAPNSDQVKGLFSKRLQSWLEGFPSSEVPSISVAVQAYFLFSSLNSNL